MWQSLLAKPVRFERKCPSGKQRHSSRYVVIVLCIIVVKEWFLHSLTLLVTDTVSACRLTASYR